MSVSFGSFGNREEQLVNFALPECDFPDDLAGVDTLKFDSDDSGSIASGDDGEEILITHPLLADPQPLPQQVAQPSSLPAAAASTATAQACASWKAKWDITSFVVLSSYGHGAVVVNKDSGERACLEGGDKVGGWGLVVHERTGQIVVQQASSGVSHWLAKLHEYKAVVDGEGNKAFQTKGGSPILWDTWMWSLRVPLISLWISNQVFTN